MPGSALPLDRCTQARRVDGNVDPSAFLRQQHDGARVAAAPAAVHRLGHLGEREIAHAHRHAELAAERVGERHILVSKAQGKGGRIVGSGQELVDQRIKGKAAARRALARYASLRTCAGLSAAPPAGTITPTLAG